MQVRNPVIFAAVKHIADTASNKFTPSHKAACEIAQQAAGSFVTRGGVASRLYGAQGSRISGPGVSTSTPQRLASSAPHSANRSSKLQELRLVVNTAFAKGFNKDHLFSMYESTCAGADKIIRSHSGAVNREMLDALRLKKFMTTLVEAHDYLRNDIVISKSPSPALAQIFSDEFISQMKGRVLSRISNEPTIIDAMEPSALAELGVSVDGRNNASAKPDHYKRLSLEHVIALTAYTHQRLNVFNVINMAYRVQGMEGPRAFFKPFHQIMEDAQFAMYGNPDFHKSGIQVYKGIRTLNEYEFGEILQFYKSHIGTEHPFIAPHIMSATTDELMSYSNRKNHDIEFKILNASIYEMHRFNHPDTAHEREVITSKGARYLITGISKREVIRSEDRVPTVIWVVEMVQIRDPIAQRFEKENAALIRQYSAAERGPLPVSTQN